MNSVKKITTFEELKFCESKTIKKAESLKNHNEFKKFILELRSNRIVQSKLENSKY